MAMRSLHSGCESLVFVVLSAAEDDVLDDFSCLESDRRSWGSEHATELGDLAGHQAVDGPSDATLQEAEARSVLELLLQLAQPFGRAAHEGLGLSARDRKSVV